MNTLRLKLTETDSPACRKTKAAGGLAKSSGIDVLRRNLLRQIGKLARRQAPPAAGRME